MCNTWRNVFLQSMKTNNLSVNKLTKNLILRALRQLYAVSEIIILIRWVTPPQKVENLQFEFFLSFEIPQLFNFFNFAMSSPFPLFFFIGYIYICEFMSSTAFTYCYFFELLFLLSECDRTLSPSMLYSTQSVQIICIVLKLSNVFSASLSAKDT